MKQVAFGSRGRVWRISCLKEATSYRYKQIKLQQSKSFTSREFYNDGYQLPRAIPNYRKSCIYEHFTTTFGSPKHDFKYRMVSDKS